MANERWDGDETGSGVSDGRAFAPPIRVLDEIERWDWNTEQPEAHLLPNLERWCAREDAPLTLRSSATQGTVFVVDLAPAPGWSSNDVHGDVYALISTIAEPTTGRRAPRGRVRALRRHARRCAGPETSPKGHGHLVRLRVAAA